MVTAMEKADGHFVLPRVQDRCCMPDQRFLPIIIGGDSPMERKGLFDLPGSVALFLGIIAPATRGLFGIIASFFQNSPPGALLLLV